jgi:hypothetical protein
MTIAISVKVNDGVVLATDSASTIIMQDPSGNIAIQNVYKSADKIFNLDKSRPIGVMTWGIGSIGNESVATLMKDLRARITGQDTDHTDWKLGKDATVLQFAEAVKKFLYNEKYQTAFKDWIEKPALGFLVAGFSPKQSIAEEYQIDIIGGRCFDPRPVRPQQEPGIVWNGEPEAITRLILGYSPHLLNVLLRDFKFSPEQTQKLQEIRGQVAAQVATAAMPIKDAIDLAEFLVETTIKFSRFSPGPTTVDGPVELAVITKHEGFKWIRRKHYYSTELNPPLPLNDKL